jgi:hypothetical protein
MHQPNGIQKLKKKAALQHSRSEKLEIKNSNIYLQFIEMLPGAKIFESIPSLLCILQPPIQPSVHISLICSLQGFFVQASLFDKYI